MIVDDLVLQMKRLIEANPMMPVGKSIVLLTQLSEQVKKLNIEYRQDLSEETTCMTHFFCLYFSFR